jgi:hypothetical protein
MLRALTGLLCLCFSIPAHAKLGETVPQLVKRFGKSYTVEPVELGKKYKFRSANVSVDAIVANGISISETYLSDHPLTPNGEPPNDIVRAVLNTNVPQARWVEIEAAPFRADYALRSSDHEYIAVLRYTGAVARKLRLDNDYWPGKGNRLVIDCLAFAGSQPRDDSTSDTRFDACCLCSPCAYCFAQASTAHRFFA